MSSLKDLASLIMIPSLVKDGRLDTVKPLGNSIIHPDATGNNDGTDGSTPAEGNFTFSRGSNLSATRVNASQLIEKGRENVLLYSQDFSQGAWSKTNLSLTANQTDPNGGANAFLFTSTSASGNLFVQSLSNQNKVCSIYAKAGNRSIFAIVNNAYGNGATFNLSAETAVSSGQGSLAVIEDVGNGWFRCSVYFSLGTQFLVVLSDVNGNGYSNGDTISFFGSQMELGTIATPYIETGASTAQAGILENTPRLDYSGGATCPSLLLEPSRTNLITQSEYFGSADWSGSGGVVVNTAISPSGYQDADTGNNIYTSTGVGDATTLHANSIFAKANPSGSSILLLRVNRYGSGVDYNECTFNLSNGTASAVTTGGTASSASAEIEDYGNGWYRCILTGIASTTAGVISFNPQNNCFIWGAQVEAGSYPTSYIPTYGVSQTRAGEGKVLTGASNIIGQTEGSVYFEFTRDGFAAYTQRILTLSNGTNSNIIGFQLAASNSITFYVINNDSLQAIITKPNATIANQKVKVAAGYAENDFVLYIDGVQVGAATSGTIPSTSVVQNNRPTGGTPFIGNIYSTLLFPTRLTNAELAALTTI